MKNKTRKEAVSQKSVGNQDGIANKQTLPSKEDKTRALNEANSLSHPSKTDQTNISSVMSQNKQLNLAKLRCPNNQEEHKSTNFFTAQVESQLKAGFHLDRVEEETQNICNNKRRQKKVKHMKNKTCEAKQKGGKSQEDKRIIPGLNLDAVVKKTVDSNLTQLSGTGATLIQYGNTSYTSYHTDHPYWAAGHYSLSAYQTGIYRVKNIKSTQVSFSFYLILI